MIFKCIKFVVDKIVRPRWIVGTGEDNRGELGIRICGVNLWYYKWPDPMLASSTTYPWRIMEKREFGETIKNNRS